jgi:hypothetical protein
MEDIITTIMILAVLFFLFVGFLKLVDAGEDRNSGKTGGWFDDEGPRKY